MNFKDLMLPLVLAFSTTLLIQFYITKKYDLNKEVGQEKTGRHFFAPKNEIIQKPLNLEIDFVDAQSSLPEVDTVVETDSAKYIFTNKGAALKSFEYKKYIGDKVILMKPLSSPSTTEKERLCFLLALSEKTPFYYELIGKKDESDYIELIYRAENKSFTLGNLEKIFRIYKFSNKIDLDINFKPNADFTGKIEPRIFFPAPLMEDIEKDEIVNALIWEDNYLKKRSRNDKSLDGGWTSPTLFGGEDKYFIHSMVRDSDKFVKRAYYKLVDTKGLFAILEGPETNKKRIWSLSFYMGPKKSESILMVDKRLEGALDYGWFSILVKLLLYLLEFIYKYLNNYGIAIIILTLIIRMLMFPFAYNGEKGIRQRMDFQKKLEHIQRKYKNNQEELARARAELIRKHGVPGLSGCLPLILQLPIFIGLSRALSSSIELYRAPFVLWIKDLSARDPYFILPLLTVIFMLWQTLETSNTNNKLSGIAIALVFGAVVTNFSSGLVLYILITTILGIIQSKMARKC